MSSALVLVLRILLVAVLYAFLGWALYTIWRDLRLNNMMVAAQRVPSIRLVIRYQDIKESQQFDLSELVIGRDENCDCCIPDETVSAHHARLSYHHKQWWVEDLQSTNGTFLNEERVSTPTVIVAGDELHLGKVLVTIDL